MLDTHITRRRLLGAAAGATAANAFAFGPKPAFRIGVTDWNLHLGAKPESVIKAAELGFEGVQISFGREVADGRMPVDRPETIARYLALSKEHGITIDGTCVDPAARQRAEERSESRAVGF